jgi:hypothetical protein
MDPTADGRMYQCAYCRAQMLVAVDSGQISRGLALDISQTEVFLDRIAAAMTSIIPEHIRVEQQGYSVMAIEIDLGKDVFVARKEGRSVAAQHRKVVRKVALKTTPMALDEWMNRLTEALANHANENARVAQAVSRLR